MHLLDASREWNAVSGLAALTHGISLTSAFVPSERFFAGNHFFEPSIAHLSVGNRLLSSIGICSKIVLILLMFIGRVGVITLGNVMLVRAHSRDVKHRSDLVV